MKAKIAGNSITIATRATPSVLAMLPALEGRRNWLKGGGLRVENTPHNRSALEQAMSDIEWEGESAGAEFFEPEAPLETFSFKREPDPHQLTALKRMEGKPYFGLFMEQGTGKTKVLIDRACKLFLDGHITGVLVVTKKGVHRQWVDAELPKDHGPPYKGDWWHGKPLPDDLIVQGGELKWFSINYDALRSAKAFDACLKFVRAHGGKLLIAADESQCIKTHTSIRHKRMALLKPHASHRVLLTGTPIAKDLTDEWAQLKWMDECILGTKYITTFRAQYCIMGGFEGRSVVGHKNMEEFRAKVEPHTYRVTKQEIGYIPKRHKEWVYDLTKEQQRLIKQVKQELTADLESGETVPVSSATAAFTKVQQIANGFIIDEEGQVIELMPVSRNPRIQAALDWLESEDGKAVVWTRFIADRRLLAAAFEASGIGFQEYTGSDDQRAAAKQSFIDDPSVRVFLANPQSAGTGLDGLQTVCSQALYYSNSFAAIDRWQSEDRIDRRGMVGGSVYTDLIGKGSLDRYVLNNLKRKKGLSAMGLGDIERAFSEA